MIISCFVFMFICVTSWRARQVSSARRERDARASERKVDRWVLGNSARVSRAGSSCDHWTGFNFRRTVIPVWTVIRPCARTVPSNCMCLVHSVTIKIRWVHMKLLWLIDSVVVRWSGINKGKKSIHLSTQTFSKSTVHTV